MKHYSITDTERQAIRKDELTEFEQKELLGKGYYLRYDRDRGFGTMHDITGKEVILQWHIGDELREDGKLYRNIPRTHFTIQVGDQEVILDKEVFHKIFRWV